MTGQTSVFYIEWERQGGAENERSEAEREGENAEVGSWAWETGKEGWGGGVKKEAIH